MRFRHLLLVIFFFTLPLPKAGQASAADDPASFPTALGESEEYRKCMRTARVEPDKGFEQALRWGDRGGGDAARHCAAVALIQLKQFGEGAKRLQTLAEKMPKNTPDPVRAELLAQAAQAWMAAGEIENAYKAQTVAIKLAPKNADILIDRAITLAARNRYDEAIKDLNAALALNPVSADGFTLRASANRFAGNMDAARQDVVHALSINPYHPEALLESGILLRLAGDAEGARQDWLTLIERHEGTPAAETAKRNLEKLDVKQR